ncbi:uncharacterized protein LOC126655838 [Mercurialis annua]|uniref:uncharacterized protein LOC126655838 n=1 Tax=Mercurialis annua TaxID=3986 RepID=UPI00215FBFBD|nr:uncharacterized protein LOC126655838 [Mercurialis annua]
MSMQQQQQPVVVYPNTMTGQQPPPTGPFPHSHHSNGSFGTVFIILAVIVVISGIACFLGRVCNKRKGGQDHGHGHGHGHHQERSKEQKKPSGSAGESQQKNPNIIRTKERGRELGDVEFGFEKGFAMPPSSAADGHQNHHMNMNGVHMKGETFSVDHDAQLKHGP